MPKSAEPIRVLTAVPICDGHDSAINTVNLEFVRNGIEVIYLGYHRPVRDVVRAAIQENVRAVGISIPRHSEGRIILSHELFSLGAIAGQHRIGRTFWKRAVGLEV